MSLVTVGQAPRDPFHRYTWEGRDLPSWSTIRATAGLKPQIHAWALEGMARMAVDLGGTIAAAEASGSADAKKWVHDRLWDAAVEAQGSAARLGTAVHEVVAGTRDDDAETHPYLRQDQDWLTVSGATVVAAEFEVINLAIGYGGTIDRLVLFPDGGLWLIDVKSGRHLWGEHALQLAGYLMAEFAVVDGRRDDRLTAMLGQVRGAAVLHLRPEGWGFHALRVDGEAWQAFRGLHRFASWMHDHEQFEAVCSGSKSGTAMPVLEVVA